MDYLWEKTKHDKYIKPVFNEAGEVGYFVLQSNDMNETEHNQVIVEEKSSLAIKLMDTLVHLLFKQGFTLPKKKTDSKLSTLE